MLEKLIDAVDPPAGVVPLEVGTVDERRVVGVLMRWFGDDPACREVYLLREGQPLGKVARVRLYAAAPELFKRSFGFGSSDDVQLAGLPNYPVVTLTCPHGDYRVMTIVLDELPECPHHPGTRLVR
jgi:hypothetical protein